jgi:hypothetical protein
MIPFETRTPSSHSSAMSLRSAVKHILDSGVALSMGNRCKKVHTAAAWQPPNQPQPLVTACPISHQVASGGCKEEEEEVYYTDVVPQLEQSVYYI